MTILLECADRIGQRLVDSAQWSDGRCTWLVQEPVQGMPNDELGMVPCNGLIYAGTAGIALFLLELFRFNPSERLKRTIEGAIRTSLIDERALPSGAVGFYAGRTGIAYLCARAHVQGIEAVSREFILGMLSQMSSGIASDRGFDVVGGAGGAITPVLVLSGLLADDATREIAFRLASHLMRNAHLGPNGISWGGRGPGVIRDLTGYAHGASGIAHGLVELWGQSNWDELPFFIEGAIDYEDSQIVSGQLWPDFRSLSFGLAISEGRTPELVETLRRGKKVDAQQAAPMVAWCHGAAGITPVRARAGQLLRSAAIGTTVPHGLSMVLSSLHTSTPGYSLCHGLSGNLDCALSTLRILEDTATEDRLKSLAVSWCEDYEMRGRPWPSGVAFRSSDPTLLRGDAGIGYTLLRLYCSSVPSVLHIQAEDCAPPPGGAIPQGGLKSALLSQLIDASATHRMGKAGTSIRIALEGLPARDIVSSASSQLEDSLVEISDEEERRRLAATFAVDLARVSIAAQPVDLVQEAIERLCWETGGVRELTYSIGTQARYLSAHECVLPEGCSDSSGLLVWRDSYRMHLLPLGALGSAIIESLRQTLSFDELVDCLLLQFEDADTAFLAPLVQRQLGGWRGAGFLSVRRTNTVDTAVV